MGGSKPKPTSREAMILQTLIPYGDRPFSCFSSSAYALIIDIGLEQVAEKKFFLTSVVF